MWHLIAVIMASMSPFCSVVRPRLSTMVSVSLEKHSVRAFTLVSADLPASPDRLKYEVHCVFHASKSVPLSTWRSSLGRSLSLNTNGMATDYGSEINKISPGKENLVCTKTNSP